ncbi:MAG: hypothetical protein U0Y68_20005 [Blastocatellia bacterium]
MWNRGRSGCGVQLRHCYGNSFRWGIRTVLQLGIDRLQQLQHRLILRFEHAATRRLSASTSLSAVVDAGELLTGEAARG